ncbi:hypothetical protein NQ318_012558 [Aromia moschata]|uniref:Uncharacterized protein n=1 Tax=Aromia moschata TaxID=1265417 RepID=A0AAV8YJE3_9CUCU|nr:hypothetical protein NQ318_012558 [Aromia moschata]
MSEYSSIKKNGVQRCTENIPQNNVQPHQGTTDESEKIIDKNFDSISMNCENNKSKIEQITSTLKCSLSLEKTTEAVDEITTEVALYKSQNYKVIDTNNNVRPENNASCNLSIKGIDSLLQIPIDMRRNKMTQMSTEITDRPSIENNRSENSIYGFGICAQMKLDYS